MSENKEQNALARVVRGKAQYLIAFGVIASLLVVANIPLFVVFFFGVFAYFMAKMFASGSRSHTREIFEFYLSAHEILRDDVRQWYGFEINETIARGEKIIKAMHSVPPLVHYALGALYHKTNDHSAAGRHLAFIAENADSSEASIVYPTAELRNYVSVLRKIEREPGDAPLTSAAVRALERARKIKCVSLLADSRIKIGQHRAGKLQSADAANGHDLTSVSQTSIGFENKGLFGGHADKVDDRPFGENENKAESRLFSGNENKPDARLFNETENTADARLFSENENKPDARLFSGSENKADARLFGGNENKADAGLFSGNENKSDGRLFDENENKADARLFSGNEPRPQIADSTPERKQKDSKERRYASRKPITEVLHDIYDKNIP